METLNKYFVLRENSSCEDMLTGDFVGTVTERRCPTLANHFRTLGDLLAVACIPSKARADYTSRADVVFDWSTHYVDPRLEYLTECNHRRVDCCLDEEKHEFGADEKERGLSRSTEAESLSSR
jgi:hypothetical protein